MTPVQLSENESEYLKDRTKTWPIKLRRESVLKLSDHYIDNPSALTPWEKEFCKIAYFSYFHPLNWLRCSAVIQRCPHFFKDIDIVHDFGCGLGAASKAIHSQFPNKKYFAYDSSSVALKLAQLNSSIGAKTPNSPPKPLGQNDLLVTSYSMTEIEKLPRWMLNFKNILFIEPALRHDSGQMINHRQELIAKGYVTWAPCTHNMACPMENSKRDWCHDKAATIYPDWLQELIDVLPMKNRKLSFSYLAMKKTSPPSQTHTARIIGDPLKEKGKTRQMICFDQHRHFISWLHREIKPDLPDRGDLVHWKPLQPVVQGGEIRLTSELKVFDPLGNC